MKEKHDEGDRCFHAMAFQNIGERFRGFVRKGRVAKWREGGEGQECFMTASIEYPF